MMVLISHLGWDCLQAAPDGFTHGDAHLLLKLCHPHLNVQVLLVLMAILQPDSRVPHPLRKRLGNIV